MGWKKREGKGGAGKKEEGRGGNIRRRGGEGNRREGSERKGR